MLWTQIQVLKQMVGYVIGRGGEHINNIQSNCGVRLQFQNGILYTLKTCHLHFHHKERIHYMPGCGDGRGEVARVSPWHCCTKIM